MKRAVHSLLAIGVALLTSSTSLAASLASSCTLKDGDEKAAVEGTAVDKRLPIASVSKIVTSWWSITTKGLDYRFPTTFYVTPVGKDSKGTTLVYDIHVQGSRDPYFGRESLHHMISQLNLKGITKVNNFTFDENFKFYWYVTSGDIAKAPYTTSSPKPATVKTQLENHDSWLEEYSITFKAAKEMGVKMVEKPAFTYKTVAHLPAEEFQPFLDTKVYILKSSPLKALVKEMNRNSNNHAANQIFEHIGGAEQFKGFAKEQLKLEEEQIRFLNGSGDSVVASNGKKSYNEASCSAMLKIIRDLNQRLAKQKLSLQDVMAVAGRDKSSTTSNIYTNDQTKGSLIAKTGTIDPDITLAGIINTKSGDYYFMYNMSTKATRADQRAARSMILKKVTELIKKLKGSDPIEYTSVKFLSFDKDSAFAEQIAKEVLK